MKDFFSISEVEGAITALLLLGAVIAAARWQRHPSVVQRPVVINGRETLRTAAQFDHDEWLVVEAAPVVQALNGTCQRLPEDHAAIITLNGKSIALGPRSHRLEGDLHLECAVSYMPDPVIRARIFVEALSFAYPGARVYTKDRQVFVETGPPVY